VLPAETVHRPEQQSSARQQTSPVALQYEAGRQVPSWQFVEQQAVVSGSQASPSVVQLPPLPEAGGIAWHLPPEQMPEQQSDPVPHEDSSPVPLGRQAADEQVAPGVGAPGQLSEQHCESDEQAVPEVLQNEVGVQKPASLHWVEQHWESRVHAAPSPPHAGGAASAQTRAPPPVGTGQLPLQQPPFAEHGWPTSAQEPCGATQVPFSHGPSQQSDCAVQPSKPMGWHTGNEEGSTHVNDTRLHAFGEQQSELTEHEASSVRQGVESVPPLFDGEQPTAAPASITVSARMVVRMMSPGGRSSPKPT
jgi:hypothetical protein